jgi:hypothetical protein
MSLHSMYHVCIYTMQKMCQFPLAALCCTENVRVRNPVFGFALALNLNLHSGSCLVVWLNTNPEHYVRFGFEHCSQCSEPDRGQSNHQLCDQCNQYSKHFYMIIDALQILLRYRTSISRQRHVHSVTIPNPVKTS